MTTPTGSVASGIGIDSAVLGSDGTIVTLDGTPMALAPVTSSNVAAVGYDEGREVLVVAFKGGSVYRYDGVPAAVHSEMKASPSIGKYLASHVKNVYRCEKVS